MGKYIRYERFYYKLSPDEINEKLKKLVEEGWEIIYYNEKYLGYLDDEQQIAVTIVCGKLNEGTKQYL